MTPEELQQFIASLPPEKQQQLMAQNQAGNQMGLPGANQGLTPQQKMDAGNPEAFRDYAGEGAIIGDQQAMAERLRGTETPQGVQTARGGYVAANPLSHVATAVNRIRGNMDAREALEAKKDLSQLKTTTQQDVAAKSLQQQQQQAEALRKKNALEQMASNQGQMVSA